MWATTRDKNRIERDVMFDFVGNITNTYNIPQVSVEESPLHIGDSMR